MYLMILDYALLIHKTNSIYILAPLTGFEPVTYGLTVHRSAN